MPKKRASKRPKPGGPRGAKKAKTTQRGGKPGKRGPSKPVPVAKSRPPKKKPRRSAGAATTDITLPPRERGDRLQKVLAAAGIASRRECETLIEEGRVEVDGEVVTDLGRRVDPFKQKIYFDGEALPRRRRVYFAVNKPDGVVTTSRDPSGRPRVTDLLPPDVGRVFAVGRLDMASEGLILVTNDGELANGLTHPRHGVEKTYHVQVAGIPTAETLSNLRRGVYLSDGHAHFVDAKLKRRRKQGAILEVVLDEGRNREIRRLLARVGHKVQRLTRVAVGPVRLGEMEPGSYRPLTREEVQALTRAIAENQQRAADEPRNPVKSTRNATKKRTGQGSRAGSPKKQGRTVLGGDSAPTSGERPKAGKRGGGAKRKGRG